MEILLNILAAALEGAAVYSIEKIKEKRRRTKTYKLTALAEKIKAIDYRKIAKVVISYNKLSFYYEDKKVLKLVFSKISDDISPEEVKAAVLAALEDAKFDGQLIVKFKTRLKKTAFPLSKDESFFDEQ